MYKWPIEPINKQLMLFGNNNIIIINCPIGPQRENCAVPNKKLIKDTDTHIHVHTYIYMYVHGYTYMSIHTLIQA